MNGEPRNCPVCTTWIQRRPDGSSGMVAHFQTCHPTRELSEAMLLPQ